MCSIKYKYVKIIQYSLHDTIEGDYPLEERWFKLTKMATTCLKAVKTNSHLFYIIT